MGLFDEVVEHGIEYSNHETDLYIPVNRKTAGLVKKYYSTDVGGVWFQECNCRISVCVSKFISQIDSKLWYDIAFAYLPAWRRKQ